jgi:hypothetical protein
MLPRRLVLASLVLVVACKSAAPAGAPAGPAGPAPGAAAVKRDGTQPAAMPVIRLSRGSFPAERYEEVRARLDATRATLVPAVRGLRGCLHFWAAIDPVSNTMLNVSVWETLADAKQMETLQLMLALAGEFIALGVTFERPITNSQVLWDLSQRPE